MIRQKILILIISVSVIAGLYFILGSSDQEISQQVSIKAGRLSNDESSNLEDKILELEGRIDDLETQLSNLESQLQNLESNQEDLESKYDSFVGCLWRWPEDVEDCAGRYR